MAQQLPLFPLEAIDSGWPVPWPNRGHWRWRESIMWWEVITIRHLPSRLAELMVQHAVTPGLTLYWVHHLEREYRLGDCRHEGALAGEICLNCGVLMPVQAKSKNGRTPAKANGAAMRPRQQPSSGPRLDFAR